MTSSGVSTRCSVLPRWPACPPGFLPLDSRRLLAFLAYPSLEGGLLLLWLSLSTRPLSSCTWVLNCSTCSRRCWFSDASCAYCCLKRAFSAWSSSMISSRLMALSYYFRSSGAVQLPHLNVAKHIDTHNACDTCLR